MFSDLRVKVEWFGEGETDGAYPSKCDYFFVDWDNGVKKGCFPICRKVFESGESAVLVDYSGCFDWHDSPERMRDADPDELMEQIDDFCDVWSGSASEDEFTRDFENCVMALAMDCIPY